MENGKVLNQIFTENTSYIEVSQMNDNIMVFTCRIKNKLIEITQASQLEIF